MPDTLCRLAVAVTGADQSGVVDLVLPSECPLGEMLPALVDAVFGDSAEPQRWYLARAAGTPLDSSMSLRDNHVQDGDLVVLATIPLPPPHLHPTELCGAVALASDQAVFSRRAVLVAGIAGTFSAAVALVWSGISSATPWHLWSAAVLAAAAATTAIVVDRSDRETRLLASAGAVAFATATGVLAVQGAGWPASSLLAAASALAMSTLLIRTTTDDGPLTASVAASAAIVAASAVCVTATTCFEIAGAVLVVISLTGLSMAARIAALTARLGATAAHRTLTGLTAGWSATAMLGAVLVAAGAQHPGSPAILAAAFCADVGVLLILRQRSHAGLRRRAWLSVGGFVALVSALFAAVTAAPAHGHWICVSAAVGCAVCVWRSGRTAEPNPMVRQSIQVAEYVALAAVIPLACWLTGLYGVVRELSLS